MNKMGLFSLFVLLAISGCGKKKEKVLEEVTNKKVASLENKDIPLFPSEQEELVDRDDAISDFAFEDVDDAVEPVMASNVNRNDNAKVLKDDEIDLMNDLLVASSDDNDGELDFKRVQFDFNKNNIRNDQKEKVRDDISLAKQAVAQGKEVVVQGHTCQIGSASYNLALSQRRADAVKQEMIKNGVPEKSIKTVGYGYESPLVWSEKVDRTEKIKELAPNRRAEIVALN